MVAPVLVAIVLSAFLFLPLLACDASAVSTQGNSTTTPVAADGLSVFPTVSDSGGRLASDPVLVIDDVASDALNSQVDSAALADPMTLFLLGGMTLVFIALVRRLRDRPVPVEVRVRARR